MKETRRMSISSRKIEAQPLIDRGAPTVPTEDTYQARIWQYLLPIPAGLLVGTASIVFAYIIVYVYYIVTPNELETVRAAKNLTSGMLPMIFFGVCVIVAAFLTAYWCGSHGLVLGLGVGFLATATQQYMIAVGYPPLLAGEVFTYGLIALVAGGAGGLQGTGEAEKHWVGQRAFERALKKMAVATTADQVAESLATVVVGGSSPGVAVWQSPPTQEELYGRLSSPTTTPDALLPDGVYSLGYGLGSRDLPGILETVYSHLGWPVRRAHMVHTTAFDEESRHSLESFGIRSVYTAPLRDFADEAHGLVLMLFATRTLDWRRASRNRISDAATMASLALPSQKTNRQLAEAEAKDKMKRNLHDSVLQEADSAKSQMAAAYIAREAGESPDDPGEDRAWDHVAKAYNAMTEVVRQIRNMIQHPTLEETNSELLDSLENLAERNTVLSGIATTFELTGEPRRLTPTLQAELWLVAQEAVSNIRKHSGADEATISLAFLDDSVRLSFVDNGYGFDADLVHLVKVRNDGTGQGIHSMRQRADEMGAALTIVPHADGTVVTVLVPEHEPATKENGNRGPRDLKFDDLDLEDR